MSLVNYDEFHTEPNVIVVVVLREKFCLGEGQACFRGGEVNDSYMCCAIAASHMTLAAEDRGISSFLLTPEKEKAKKLLKIPKEDTVPVFVGLGY